MSAELAITPRNLGVIKLKMYCPACLKFLLLLKFKPPYNHFGAQIFHDAQRAQEAILGYYFKKDGCLPKEFAPFCDCVERVECDKRWSKYRHTHKSGVLLYGQPDEVLRLKDGSVCILDHKTARNKGDADQFHGQYETQVVGYGYIAEGLGLGKTTKGGLLYWEVQIEAVEANPFAHYKGSAVSLPLKPSPLEVKMDYRILDPLIKELKSVWNADELPAGRDGCDDCKRRELLFAIDEEYKRQDATVLRDYAHVDSIRQAVKRRMWGQTAYRRRLLTEFGAVGDDIFSRDGVIANWEFLPLQDSVEAAIV